MKAGNDSSSRPDKTIYTVGDTMVNKDLLHIELAKLISAAGGYPTSLIHERWTVKEVGPAVETDFDVAKHAYLSFVYNGDPSTSCTGRLVEGSLGLAHGAVMLRNHHLIPAVMRVRGTHIPLTRTKMCDSDGNVHIPSIVWDWGGDRWILDWDWLDKDGQFWLDRPPHSDEQP